MGYGSYAGNPTLFGELNNVNVGKYCSIAVGVVFDCGLNHNMENISTYPFNKIFPGRYGNIISDNTTKGDINIGNDVWIGRDVTIMSGVTIGDGAVIGTKSLVTKDVEPYSVVGGTPAKHIKYRFDSDTVDFLKRVKWWDEPLDEIDAIVSILMSGDVDSLRRHYASKKYYNGFRICFMTRSMNENLYSKMRSLLSDDFEFVRNTSCHGDQGGSKYLYDIILDSRYDWVINIDEDFFTFNEKAIFELLDYMIENEYDYCGISDGGMCTHRRHSPIVMNPFFNIFNTLNIRAALDSVSYVESFKYNEAMEKNIPLNIKDGFEWVNDNYEPYYPFFYWLPERGFKPLYLNSVEHSDDISTIVHNHKGDAMGIHTWYTRNYGRDDFHTTRIDSAYQLARGKSAK